MKHQLTFKSGSSYEDSWEVTNKTLCAMENQVEELKSLLDELYEAREDIPSACKCYGQTAPKWFTSK